MVSRGSLYILPVFHSVSNSSCCEALRRALTHSLSAEALQLTQLYFVASDKVVGVCCDGLSNDV